MLTNVASAMEVAASTAPYNTKVSYAQPYHRRVSCSITLREVDGMLGLCRLASLQPHTRQKALAIWPHLIELRNQVGGRHA